MSPSGNNGRANRTSSRRSADFRYRREVVESDCVWKWPDQVGNPTFQQGSFSVLDKVVNSAALTPTQIPFDRAKRSINASLNLFRQM
jgi:hypothetical protein